MTHALTAAISGIMDAQKIENGFFITPVPGLRLLRSFEARPPVHMNYRPALCIVAQGKKQVFVGDTVLEYGAMQSLVITVDVPVLGQIVQASPEEPFVGATLVLDMDILMDVASRLDGLKAGGPTGLGLLVSDVDEQIAASIIRLLDLANRPQGVEILYPAAMREICYWLLTGPAGPAVARMVLPAGPALRIARSIRRLREAFDAPVSVTEMAEAAGMSVSAFHQHFRALTSMSPLQYQKHLRLLEARRLMLNDGERAGIAAMVVGYESVSQFNREYARMFGAPPRRETQRARAKLADAHPAVSLDALAGAA